MKNKSTAELFFIGPAFLCIGFLLSSLFLKNEHIGIVGNTKKIGSTITFEEEKNFIIEEKSGLDSQKSILKKLELIIDKLENTTKHEDFLLIYHEIITSEWKAYDEGKIMALELLMEKWSLVSPKQTLREFKINQYYGADIFFNVWSKQNPQEAFQYYFDNRSDWPEDSIVNAIFSGWFEIDKKSAWKHLKSNLFDKEERKKLEHDFLTRLCLESPKEIGFYIDEISDDFIDKQSIMEAWLYADKINAENRIEK